MGGYRGGPVRGPARAGVDVDEVAPFLSWDELYSYLRTEFKQGDHVAILGPTGTGKTHMALAIAEIRAYVLVVACKPKDELVTDAIAKGYWQVPGNKLEIPYVDGRPHHKKVLYWPRLPAEAARKLPNSQLLRHEKALHKPLVGGALGYVKRNGKWCIVLDEGTYVCRDLGLQTDVDSALQQFRSLEASIIVLGQRPAWMGRYVLSQPSHLFLFHTANREDAKALGDITGIDSQLVKEIVPQLDREAHECLYIGPRQHVMYRTIAPPR